MKKTLLLLAGALALTVHAADPVTEDTALTLNISAKAVANDVVLFKNGTNTDGVCYYKMTLSASKKCTIWLEEQSDASIAIVSAYAKQNWDMSVSEPGSIFSKSVYGKQTRWVFTGEDWSDDWGGGWDDDDDWGDDWGDDDWDDDPKTPSTWTYYLAIRGNIGATAKLYAVSGILVPTGTASNPLSITMKDAVQTNTVTFTEVNYFVTTKLEAGRRYYIGVTGGTEDFDLQFDGLGGLENTNYMPWDSEHNDSRILVAEEDMTWNFNIEPSAEGAQTAKLFYRADAVRAIGAHKSEALTVGEAVTCKPGYKNNPATGAYDQIIDDALYSFKVEKGCSYRVETSGAQYALEMIVYDAKGKPIASNKGKGLGSLDVRCSFEVSAAGTYYVGVCQETSALEPTEIWDMQVDLCVTKVASTGKEIAAEAIDVAAGKAGDSPYAFPKAVGPIDFDGDRWYRTYSFNGRKGMTYQFGHKLVDSETSVETRLRFEVYYLSGKAEKSVASFSIASNGEDERSFLSKLDTTYYLRVSVANGMINSILPNTGLGTDYPLTDVYLFAFDSDGVGCGALKVAAQGTKDATWTLGTEKTAYANGATLVLPVGEYTVKYATVKGFSAPSSRKVTVTAGETTVVNGDYYSDTYDHKDDVKGGATSWTLKATETSFTRTLWPDDPADWYSFDGKDGCYFTFALRDIEGDATFTIINDSGFELRGQTSVEKLVLPKQKTKYFLTVEHGTVENVGGGYTLAGFMANVGSIKFAKTAVEVKDTATSVSLTVNRTAKEGQVRVHYETVGAEALPGYQYVEQSGSLVWENGDNKAKTITITLIPKLIAAYNYGPRTFNVQLRDDGGEYPADIATEQATVKILETSKTSDTVESVYAKKAPKLATVKTEEGALRGGTFFGVVQAASGSLTNGLPELASITLTVTAKGGTADTSKDTMSAKVALGGKSYTFKTASKETPWDDETPSEKVKTLTLETTVNKVKYVNTLKLEVADGATTDPTAWLDALAKATLTMNVPDANNKGVQEGVVYTGDLYRQNAKIQAYLNVVTNFTGYYTVALANANTDETVAPAGNGYLTVTVDNKGTAKVAGLLADNTKISLSVTATAVCETEAGYEMRLPLYIAKSPYCFGGEITLRAKKISAKKPNGEWVNPDSKDFDVVVSVLDSSLIWNNDNGAITYAGQKGWALAPTPVGGWYDTVFNLQNYYKDYAMSVKTSDISEFPKEALTEGYVYVSTEANDPNGFPVSLQSDAFTTASRSYVKTSDKKLNDLENSVNPFNVQLKLARATGVVTGSFSLWSYNAAQNKQKEITGIKHNGILLLQRDDADTPLAADVLTAGFFNQTVKVSDGKKTRSCTISKPFNVTAETVDE